MLLLALVLASLLLAFIPAALFIRNLSQYRRPRKSPQTDCPSISVLIPARDEERSICAAVQSALASRDVQVEIIVLDDHSTDRTAELVQSIARSDPRVRLEAASPLPPGWCGKQFACHILSSLSSHDILCFCDADVRLEPEGLASLAGFLESSGAALVSGFPRQETGTFLERALIPLMHFLLLGYLPIAASRRKYLNPAFGAGCGQLFLAERGAYQHAGGHAAIRSSRQDGITLPRAFRKAGFRTDVCDATPVAACRMYHNWKEVLFGLLKNATEGIAAPGRIAFFTLLLAGGHVLPLFLLVFCSLRGHSRLALLSLLAVLLSYLPRLLAVRRFQQPLSGAVFHPFSIFVFLALQWYAFARQLVGTPAVWKGRKYQTT
jgi:glycosyltransferase involved in cell wall biosynthesis